MSINRARAAALLPVITAFANGKTIQWRRIGTDRWIDDSGVGSRQDFGSDMCEFRIKPRPEEFFITVYGDAREAVESGVGDGGDPHDVPCIGLTYHSANAAKLAAMPNARIFKVVEVTK